MATCNTELLFGTLNGKFRKFLKNFRKSQRNFTNIPLPNLLCKLSKLQASWKPWVGTGGISRILWKKGIVRPVGVPGFWEEGVVNQSFGYSTSLKGSGSFISYIRCIITEIRCKLSLLFKHGDFGKEFLHCFVVQGG